MVRIRVLVSSSEEFQQQSFITMCILCILMVTSWGMLREVIVGSHCTDNTLHQGWAGYPDCNQVRFAAEFNSGFVHCTARPHYR